MLSFAFGAPIPTRAPAPSLSAAALEPAPTQSAEPAPIAQVPAPKADPRPAQLRIPSISLHSPVAHMGINSKGDMDVPDGSTNQVGWYKDGTLPGAQGSAVLAAHVYAAFKNLHKVQYGSDIYVEAADGSVQHFRVAEIKLYPLADLSPDELFNRSDAKRLTLITCAGAFSKKLGTYDHRLVVYATLVE